LEEFRPGTASRLIATMEMDDKSVKWCLENGLLPRAQGKSFCFSNRRFEPDILIFAIAHELSRCVQFDTTPIPSSNNFPLYTTVMKMVKIWESRDKIDEGQL